jgi:hypothetical protein
MAAIKSDKSSHNVLIVENDNGEVYIVENEESISQVEKILKSCGKVRKLTKPSLELQDKFTSPKRIKISR